VQKQPSHRNIVNLSLCVFALLFVGQKSETSFCVFESLRNLKIHPLFRRQTNRRKNLSEEHPRNVPFVELLLHLYNGSFGERITGFRDLFQEVQRSRRNFQEKFKFIALRSPPKRVSNVYPKAMRNIKTVSQVLRP
jgi:hypothetical protein